MVCQKLYLKATLKEKSYLFLRCEVGFWPVSKPNLNYHSGALQNLPCCKSFSFGRRISLISDPTLSLIRYIKICRYLVYVLVRAWISPLVACYPQCYSKLFYNYLMLIEPHFHFQLIPLLPHAKKRIINIIIFSIYSKRNQASGFSRYIIIIKLKTLNFHKPMISKRNIIWIWAFHRSRTRS